MSDCAAEYHRDLVMKNLEKLKRKEKGPCGKCGKVLKAFVEKRVRTYRGTFTPIIEIVNYFEVGK